MLTKGAMGNLVNKYRAVLKKCRLLNVFGSLAVAGMLVMGGAGNVGAATYHWSNQDLSSPVYDGNDTIGIGSTSGTVNVTGNVDLRIHPETPAWYPSGVVATKTLNLGEAGSIINIDVNNTATSGRYLGEGMGIYGQGNDASITVNADVLKVKVQSANDGSLYGVAIQGNGSDTAANLNINAAKTYIDVVNPSGIGSAIVAFSGGKLNIDGGDLYVNTQGGVGRAILTRGGEGTVININQSGQHTVQLNGDIMFSYNAATSGTAVDANVNINLTGPDSYWQGNTVKSWSGVIPAGKDTVEHLTVSLSDGAQWTPRQIASTALTEPTGSAYVPLNNLSLADGVINLNPGVDVEVDTINGSGTVNLDADVADAADAGSMKADAGSAKLDVNLTNVTADDVSNEQAAQLVARVKEGDAAVETTGHVEEGLVRGAMTIDNAGNVTEATNTVMEDSLDLLSVTPLAVNRILMNDVRKRLGDLRLLNGATGLWVRYDGGRLSGSSGLKDQFNTVQVGADTLTPIDNLRVGAVFSYTNGDAEYRRGDADMDIYSLGLYGVWNADNGLFADVIGRLNWMNTDLDVEKHHGSVDTFAASVSAELGWNVRLNDWFFVEPQLEAAYTYVDGNNFDLGPASYKLDNMDSFIGRGGLSFGVNLPDNRGSLYARASAVHEFLGDAKISGQVGNLGSTYTIGGEDTWIEYGIGGTIRLTDQAYVYLDLERTDGARIDEDWRGSIGFRYAF